VSGYTENDYEAIEAAVQESPRGRWFLGEFARRNRAADTLMLLEAIHKLERGVAENAPHVSDELASELQWLSKAIDKALAGDAGDATEQLASVKQKVDGLLSDRAGTVDGAALTAESLKYFEGAEDLFEPGPAAATSAPLMVVGETQGRLPDRKQPGQTEASAPKGDPKDRIVFIRRASSLETSIPLADEAEDAANAGQS
jgi:ElaB/YqjD/DUF883 family membrane-anchored ribosome-binding protein